ncbi:MAG: sulfate ABC transporter permease, partial [Candidatus Binataceae bacterium]|nr:sulfate ABC transporter permease [Candidatus Binataceae bacterium]
MRFLSWSRIAMLLFSLALLYPLAGLFASVGRWQWDGGMPGSTLSAVKVSLGLTVLAMLIDIVIGTPVAVYLARRSGPDRITWEAVILISVLMPPLALGILLSLAFGPQNPLGAWLMSLGIPTSNSATA